MILADGAEPDGKSAAEFLRTRIRDQDRLTIEVSSLFFGVNISCAQCHDHPLAKDWKQDHFYGLKSFLARTFENGGFIGERKYGLVTYLTPKGEQRQAKLMFLSGQIVDEPESASRTTRRRRRSRKSSRNWRERSGRRQSRHSADAKYWSRRRSNPVSGTFSHARSSIAFGCVCLAMGW